MEMPKCVLLAVLRAYKYAVSPLLPPSCRYVPTCSEYATEAVDRHGVLRGSALSIARVLRCHPFARGGYDPVPLCQGNRTDKITRATSNHACTSH